MAEEHVAYRYEDDGKPIKVYLRKCQNCRCWFGTPWYQDEFCCPHCMDAAKKRNGGHRRRGKDGYRRKDD
jgi:hypothetical protein